MPKGSQYYSADMVQLVAQANRAMEQERRRQAAGGDAATKAGAVALHYAERELAAIYGVNAEVQKLSLKGVTDPAQVQKIVDAAKRITGSRMLTVKGRREAEQKTVASFFGVDRGKITAKQKRIWKGLMGGQTSIIEQLKESAAGYAAGSIKDAVNMMIENGLTSGQITAVIEGYTAEAKGAADAQSVYDYLADVYPNMDWSV